MKLSRSILVLVLALPAAAAAQTGPEMWVGENCPL